VHRDVTGVLFAVRHLANGCFDELTAYEANLELAYFLPFGCSVREREEFENALEVAEWSNLPATRIETKKRDVDGRCFRLVCG